MWPFSSSSPSPSADASGSLTTATASPRLTNAELVDPKLNPLNPQGLKPCCACPDTKKLRDDCFLRYGSNVDDEGESRDKCRDIVEAHKRCMRGLGFNV